MLGKISSDTNVLRVNGVEAASSSVDQGAATTYGNRQLFIGGRSGTFACAAMDLYALLAINRTLNAQELARAEAWAAAKCGVVL